MYWPILSLRNMKERLMEKFGVLPFSAGCSSQASVAVGKSPPTKSKSDNIHQSTHQNINVTTSSKQVGEECSSKGRSTKNYSFNISSGIHRLIRITVKSFSQLFVYKDIEEVSGEMEIGFPTDVKHVTHIGLDGSTTTTTNHFHVKPGYWGDHFSAPDHNNNNILANFPSISLKQFELAMAAQTQHSPLIV